MSRLVLTKSKYSAKTTADEIANDVTELLGTDLSHIHSIVTGANSGIGKETTRVLAKHGAHVILACRSKEKGEAALKEIVEETKTDRLSVAVLDLASLESVQNFAKEFLDSGKPLNLLINNAGRIAGSTYSETSDGFETNFGANYVGPFLLTNLLLPKLKEAESARIVFLSSKMKDSGKLDWENNFPPNKDHYSIFPSYGTSKLFVAMQAHELQRRLNEENVNNKITVYSLHPGVIPETRASSNMPKMMEWLFKNVIAYVPGGGMVSIPQGAATTLFCALHPDVLVHAGEYFDACQVVESAKESPSTNDAKKLWEETEKLIASKQQQ